MLIQNLMLVIANLSGLLQGVTGKVSAIINIVHSAMACCRRTLQARFPVRGCSYSIIVRICMVVCEAILGWERFARFRLRLWKDGFRYDKKSRG